MYITWRILNDAATEKFRLKLKNWRDSKGDKEQEKEAKRRRGTFFPHKTFLSLQYKGISQNYGSPLDPSLGGAVSQNR